MLLHLHVDLQHTRSAPRDDHLLAICREQLLHDAVTLCCSRNGVYTSEGSQVPKFDDPFRIERSQLITLENEVDDNVLVWICCIFQRQKLHPRRERRVADQRIVREASSCKQVVG